MPRTTRSITAGALGALAALVLGAAAAPAATTASGPASVSSAVSSLSAERGHLVVAHQSQRMELARKRESNRCRALRKKGKRNPALRMCDRQRNRGRGGKRR